MATPQPPAPACQGQGLAESRRHAGCSHAERNMQRRRGLGEALPATDVSSAVAAWQARRGVSRDTRACARLQGGRRRLAARPGVAWQDHRGGRHPELTRQAPVIRGRWRNLHLRGSHPLPSSRVPLHTSRPGRAAAPRSGVQGGRLWPWGAQLSPSRSHVGPLSTHPGRGPPAAPSPSNVPR